MPHPFCIFEKKAFLGLFVVLFFAYFIPNQAAAQAYYSSVSTAAGGTGRGAVEPGDALLLNPSALPHLQGRFLNFSAAEDVFFASLSDNTKESALPAGASFIQKKSKLAVGNLLEDFKHQDIAITFADFIVDKWTVGITGHYIEQSLGLASYIHTNADLGFLYIRNPNLGLALVFYNVFGEKGNLPVEIREKFSVATGMNFIYHDTIRFKVEATSESILAVGLETYLNKFFITRLGYSEDFDDERQILCAGLGFNGPRFQLNYAYLGNTQKSSDYRQSVDMVIPF